ncbi:MAG: glycosyl transferase family 36 [Planctomycetes bacterium]|nr:glycosyl transferase family 36 [Planctomycetota bacterium]
MSSSLNLSATDVTSESAAGMKNAYGHFTPDGREFWVTNPKPPRPWVNIIANPQFGLAVSHTGSGFSWIGNSQLAVLTRWEQDLARDSSGRFLYARDADTGRVWSLAPAPCFPAYDRYECRHGIGYTTIVSQLHGIAAEWTLFAHAEEPIEYWRVQLTDLSGRARRIELCGFVEWCMGVSPSPRREFHKLFIDTRFDSQRGAIFAHNHMWEAVHSETYGHWNTDFPYVAAFACSEPLLSAQGDKSAFLGRYGDFAKPAALGEDLWRPQFGRHGDAIGALRCVVELRAGGSKRADFALAAGDDQARVERLLDQAAKFGQNGAAHETVDKALEQARAGWTQRLSACRIETPEPTLNFLNNDWVRYQAISGRIWGRAGYYQQSGAYGFRDQLQDSQVWLQIDPRQCRRQLRLHAAHQFADGSVYHWWHPLTEQGHITRMTDDLLWLAYVSANYIRETGDLSVLDETAPFVDDKEPKPLLEHVRRAFARVFKRTSPRGIPYIGAGDWNDGLNAVGLQERGESFWLAEFLAGLLGDWAEIYRRIGALEHAGEFERRRTELVAAINQHGWDGQWYTRATLDDGRKLGSRENRVGRIFLNAQVWAILNDVAPPDRAAQCFAAVKEQLISPAGALLLAPAFDAPIREIGYITRYAPGLRENGGVYTHAATWAIAAACKMRDRELVGRLLTAINPALKDPDRYWAEPYVLPGNVDGPDSPHHGRAGWTWYTGSASWLNRIITHWVMGVRPEWAGLCFDPCLPTRWNRASLTRPYRGVNYRIRIERAENGAGPTCEVTVGGKRIDGNVVPPPARAGGEVDVLVRFR